MERDSMTRGVLAAPGELARGILSAPSPAWPGALLQPRVDLARALSQPSCFGSPGGLLAAPGRLGTG
eukprot:8267618-Lingulodinium_polyedra.AAC.1